MLTNGSGILRDDVDVDDSTRRIDAMRQFVAAAQSGDTASMRSLMDDQFVGYITTAEAGVRSANRDEYVASIEAMDVGSAALRLDVPNIVAIPPDGVLAMIEVHAHRSGQSLHNFSGQLGRFTNGRLRELWMVEALPARSDEFWSTT